MPDAAHHNDGNTAVREGSLARLKDLRDDYQRHLCMVLACGRSLLITDTWYYDPGRVDGVLEIADHIRKAALGLQATGKAIRAAEKRLGL